MTAGDAEGGLGLCFRCQGDLTVAHGQVHDGDESDPPQVLCEVVDLGKVIAIEL